jgi:hypothetical protein
MPISPLGGGGYSALIRTGNQAGVPVAVGVQNSVISPTAGALVNTFPINIGDIWAFTYGGQFFPQVGLTSYTLELLLDGAQVSVVSFADVADTNASWWIDGQVFFTDVNIVAGTFDVVGTVLYSFQEIGQASETIPQSFVDSLGFSGTPGNLLLDIFVTPVGNALNAFTTGGFLSAVRGGLILT